MKIEGVMLEGIVHREEELVIMQIVISTDDIFQAGRVAYQLSQWLSEVAKSTGDPYETETSFNDGIVEHAKIN